MKRLSNLKGLNIGDTTTLSKTPEEQRDAAGIYADGKIYWGDNGDSHTNILKENDMKISDLSSYAFLYKIDGMVVMDAFTSENCTPQDVSRATSLPIGELSPDLSVTRVAMDMRNKKTAN